MYIEVPLYFYLYMTHITMCYLSVLTHMCTAIQPCALGTVEGANYTLSTSSSRWALVSHA